MDGYLDEFDREAQRTGYTSPWSFSPDDRNLTLDGTRLREDPCENCGIGQPIFEAMVLTPELPTEEPKPGCEECGCAIPLFWRCPECGFTSNLVLDRFHAR